MNNYSFFLFTMLVNDTLIKVNNLNTPYDQLHPLVVEHHQIFKGIDNNFNISEYEAIEDYIKNSGSLLADLIQLHEEYN